MQDHHEPIKVDLLCSDRFTILNRLGMTALRRLQTDFATGIWDRDLGSDPDVYLSEGGEDELQIADLPEDATVFRLATRDGAVPKSMEELRPLVEMGVKALRRGEVVLIHCRGGVGRPGLATACLAIAATDAKVSANDAIDLVLRSQAGAIENEEQKDFIADFELEWREIMANRGAHYLLYWQERSVMDHASNDLPLDVIASNQLMRVVPGDTIWIATLTEDRELVLAGRMVVGEIVEYEEALRRLPDAGLWQAEYYAFPEPGTEEHLDPANIHDRAEEIRFESENDRLIVRDGAINPQQLQSMRKLTRETAELFEQLFEVNEGIHLDDVDPAKALELVLEWVQNEPDEPHAHYNLGVALCNNRMDEEAIAAFERTLELDPDYFVAQYNLGNTLVRLGCFEEAIEELNKAILIDGDYAPAHFMLGVAYYEAGRHEDAVAATRQGLEIDPSDDGAFYNIAYWTFQNGDYRRAIGFCDDVIAQFPFFTSPHVLKGQCFRELGELDNEIRAYRSAVDIKVDDEGAFVINMTALFFLGAAWERKITGSDEGIEYVEADNYFDLRDPLHQFCFAMGHLAQGDTEDAADTLESLRETSLDFARRLEFAIAYVDRGFRDTQPVPVDGPRESQPEVPRRTDVFAGDTRRNDPAQTQPDQQRKPRKLIRLVVDGTEIVAKHNPDLYSQVLKILVERGALESLELPISSGRKRNLVSRSPIHKDGSNFLAPVEYGGYFMESHSSREQGMKILRGFLEDLGIESSVVDEEAAS